MSENDQKLMNTYLWNLRVCQDSIKNIIEDNQDISLSVINSIKAELLNLSIIRDRMYHILLEEDK